MSDFNSPQEEYVQVNPADISSMLKSLHAILDLFGEHIEINPGMDDGFILYDQEGCNGAEIKNILFNAQGELNEHIYVEEKDGVFFFCNGASQDVIVARVSPMSMMSLAKYSRYVYEDGGINADFFEDVSAKMTYDPKPKENTLGKKAQHLLCSVKDALISVMPK